MKKIIYIAGDPGTGKSTVGLELAKKIKAAIIDKDTMCDTLTHFIAEYVGEKHPKDSTLYERHLRNLEYSSMEKIMIENIIALDTVVMIAPFGKEVKPESEYFQNLKFKMKKKYNMDVQILIFIITCSPEENRLRITKRNRKDDFLKIKNWEKYAKKRKLGESKIYHIYTKAEIENNDQNVTVNQIFNLINC
jgi:dephospho-CoA kinase